MIDLCIHLFAPLFAFLIAFDLRNQVYRKLETLSFSYHDQHQTGQLMTRATSDVEAVRSFFAQGLLQFISAILTLVGSAIILINTDSRLALASLATIPPIVFIFYSVFTRLGPRYRRVQQKLGSLNRTAHCRKILRVCMS